MGRPRSELQALLKTITPKVYFQPTPKLVLEYPCIIYKRDDAYTEFADNAPYKNCKRYQVTVIDRNPDSLLPEAVSELPMCRFNRFYTAEDLNHDVFNLFF